jgi:hypothetical protein
MGKHVLPDLQSIIFDLPLLLNMEATLSSVLINIFSPSLSMLNCGNPMRESCWIDTAGIILIGRD